MTPWIATYTGRRINPSEMMSADVDIRDIAHALSNICRFGGHSSYFYSVAEHSVHVARIVAKHTPEVGLYALLHDAAEAYIGDIVSPLKQTEIFQELLGEIEDEIFDSILRRFRIDVKSGWGMKVMAADHIALAVEGQQLFTTGIKDWNLDVTEKDLREYNFALSGWDPVTAKREFMNAAINYNLSGYNGVQ